MHGREGEDSLTKDQSKLTGLQKHADKAVVFGLPCIQNSDDYVYQAAETEARVARVARAFMAKPNLPPTKQDTIQHAPTSSPTSPLPTYNTMYSRFLPPVNPNDSKRAAASPVISNPSKKVKVTDSASQSPSLAQPAAISSALPAKT